MSTNLTISCSSTYEIYCRGLTSLSKSDLGFDQLSEIYMALIKFQTGVMK